MANEGQLPFTGNIVADPELRFTPSGAAVANFSVAVTPKVWDKNEGKHVDGTTVFWPCTVWRDFAENVAATLTKGMRVTGLGKVVEDNFEDKEGNKRSVKKLDIESIGPDLRFATAKVSKSSGGQSGGQQSGGFGGGQQSGGYGSYSGNQDFKPAYRDPNAGQGGGYDQWSTSQPGGGDRWSQ